MQVKISDHFDYKHLIKFTISPIIMMVFCSIYSVVDGIMVSNVAGKNALAAVNIVFPLVMIIGSFGYMLGSGGSAEIAKTIGEGKKDLAQEYFTFIIFMIGLIALVFSSFCLFNLRELCYLFGASDLIIDECMKYGKILLACEIFFMLQSAFQTILTTAEKPKLGLFFTVASGISNIVFDYIFIVICDFGITGAALGTVSGWIIGGVCPIFYFARKNDSLLRFRKTKLYFKMLLRSCSNGISEMMTNISSSVVCAIINVKLMNLIGEDGVSAYSIMMYVDFVFKAMMLGFCMGQAPIISYNYGAKNKKELKNVYKMALTIMIISSLAMFTLSQASANTLSGIFVSNDESLKQLTYTGFRIFALNYIFCGINIFASSFFTALCNGAISGTVSFLRCLAMPILNIYFLPELFGINGIWLTTPLAELTTMIISIVFIFVNRKKYGYN